VSEQPATQPPRDPAGPALHPLVPPGIFLALTLVLSFPLWTDPDGLFIDGQFQWSQVWGTFLLDTTVRGGGLVPLETDYLNYPEGGVVVLIGWSCHLLAFLLGLVLPLTAAFNIAVLVHLWAAPYAAFLFCRRICGSDLASLAGGVLFGFSSFVVEALCNGQLDQYCHVWIPAFLLALLRSLDVLSVRRLALLGLAHMGLLFSNPYGALFCCLMAPALTLRWLVCERGPGWPARLGASVAVCLPLAVVAHWYFARLPDCLLQPPNTTIMEGSIDLASLSVARLGSTDLIPLSFSEGHGVVIYVGLVALLLSLVALVDRRRRQTAFWWVAWLLVLSLALGNIAPTSAGGFKLPLWYLAWLLPFMGKIYFAERFMVLAYLLLGVLATYGLSALLLRVKPRARVPLVALVVTLLMLDQVQPGSAPPMTPREGLLLRVTRIVRPRVYLDIAEEVGRGAVLEFPCQLNLDGAPDGDSVDYCRLGQMQMYYQTIHRRRMANMPKNNMKAAAFSNPAMRMLATGCFTGGHCRASAPERRGAARLASAGFSDLILHTRALPPELMTTTQTYLDSLFTLRARYPDGILRYSVTTPARPLHDGQPAR